VDLEILYLLSPASPVNPESHLYQLDPEFLVRLRPDNLECLGYLVNQNHPVDQLYLIGSPGSHDNLVILVDQILDSLELPGFPVDRNHLGNPDRPENHMVLDYPDYLVVL